MICIKSLMADEVGFVISAGRGEIAHAAAFIEWFGEGGKRIYGDTIPAHAADPKPMTSI